MNPGKVVIKKYANRRLYDTSSSRYINLEDIAGMVRNGKDVQVLDASTGEDVTRVTLTQIIVEDARGQPSGLPLELLRQLIVASDRVGQEFIMWYLKSAFDAYQNVQSSVKDRISQMQSAAMSPLSVVRNFLQTPPGQGEAQSDELRELRQRIAELEATQGPTKARQPRAKSAKKKAPRPRK